jgi:hypothetical protein
MPTVKFTTIVETQGKPDSDELASADAASYLSYADVTDTFSMRGSVNEVDISPRRQLVCFRWEGVVSSEEELETIQMEYDNLSRVRTHWTQYKF